MNENLAKIQRTAEKTAGGPVIHLETVPIVETFRGAVIWEGIVEVFAVGNPPPEKIYGWAAISNDRPDYIAVLGTPPINSPWTQCGPGLFGKPINSRADSN